MLNLEQAKELFGEIVSAAQFHDDKLAHIKEDELREETLRTIAEGNLTDTEHRELAEYALRSSGLRFERHVA